MKSRLITLGLSSKSESEVTALKEVPALKNEDPFPAAGFLIFSLGMLLFFGYLWGDEVYRPIELARSGRSAQATVNSCQVLTRYVGREANTQWFTRCQITYNDQVGSIDHRLSLGQRISVLYLPYNPSVVLLGDHGDSWRTILVRNEGGFGPVIFVVGFLLYFGLPIAWIGVCFKEIFWREKPVERT